MYIVSNYKIYLNELLKHEVNWASGELFIPVLRRVPINFIFPDNVPVCILCLYCNVVHAKKKS